MTEHTHRTHKQTTDRKASTGVELGMCDGFDVAIKKRVQDVFLKAASYNHRNQNLI